MQDGDPKPWQRQPLPAQVQLRGRHRHGLRDSRHGSVGIYSVELVVTLAALHKMEIECEGEKISLFVTFHNL